MIRVRVIVEGQTEEAFVNDVLSAVLWPHGVYLIPILLGNRGGRPTYARARKDIRLHLSQEPGAYCTTMLDFYGLGDDFPGMPVPPGLSNMAKVEYVEQSVRADLLEQFAMLRPDLRLVPYIQLHEFEGLLFSHPPALAAGINRPDLAAQFQLVRDEFETPEDINNDEATAPSKRILAACPSYRKVIQGTLAAQAVGVECMLRECPHFRDWVRRLKTLTPIV